MMFKRGRQGELELGTIIQLQRGWLVVSRDEKQPQQGDEESSLMGIEHWILMHASLMIPCTLIYCNEHAH